MRFEARWLVVTWLAGCGIPEDRPLTELSPNEQERLCNQHVSRFEEEQVTCGGVELTYEAVSLSDCLDGLETAAQSDCDATVWDWSQCSDELADDVCSALAGDLTAACRTWAACLAPAR